MEKVKVEICCGTACYLLGAEKLMNIEDALPEECRGKVEIEARTCLDLCERENLGGAPYVSINDSEIMSNANVEKLIQRLSGLAEGE